MWRFLKIVLFLVLGLAGLVTLLVAIVVGSVYWNASESDWPRSGEIAEVARPEDEVRARAAVQRETAERLDAPAQKHILFGDLHVHTAYSTDALVQTLPGLGGEGSQPPADACDFARFCSALDFWSINDHAEGVTPAEWAETKNVIRRCNRVAGDPANPDLVSFLGWEWGQVGFTPESHFGHKNVVLLGTEEGEVPARPIGASAAGEFIWNGIGLATSLGDRGRWGEYADLHASMLNLIPVDSCPDGVDVHDLPSDCRESALTPDVLFEKLDQWGHPALVIPHGLAWGTTNPEGTDLSLQLSGEMHDPERQRLLEVYSGHGNSEVFTESIEIAWDGATPRRCAEPSADFEPCCWRAAEVARARCAAPESAECRKEIDEARAGGVGLVPFLSPASLVDGSTLDDFGDCNQLRGAFLPAFNYRPGGSAQYGLAVGTFEEGRDEPHRFRLGLMASSDTHRARGGKGYKEFDRTFMTDGSPTGSDWRDGRASAFYYTGGLVAVHSPGRDRRSIFDALHRREVYGTSGDRILLWFDLVREDGSRVPMGSEVEVGETPRFEVRAAGAFEQLPGCPASAGEGLTPERLARVCRGECYNPGEERRAITRIEVVRIRPQVERGEDVASLIEDPWKVIECPGDPSGCSATFADADLAPSGREAVYYVRAIQEPTPAINGDPLNCERDSDGACVRPRPCKGGGAEGLPVDDCLAEVEERAWSSPIFVKPTVRAGEQT